MKIPNTAQVTLDATGRLAQLAEGLKGWSLLTALYAGDQTDNDEAAAFAEQGRRIVLHSILLTLQLALAGLDGNRKHFNRLLRQLEETDQRERAMARLLRAALVRAGKKKEMAAQ